MNFQTVTVSFLGFRIVIQKEVRLSDDTPRRVHFSYWFNIPQLNTCYTVLRTRGRLVISRLRREKDRKGLVVSWIRVIWLIGGQSVLWKFSQVPFVFGIKGCDTKNEDKSTVRRDIYFKNFFFPMSIKSLWKSFPSLSRLYWNKDVSWRDNIWGKGKSKVLVPQDLDPRALAGDSPETAVSRSEQSPRWSGGDASKRKFFKSADF